MTNTLILPPNPAKLIEGLRDTGYNFNTALADIVDNSVDAKATKIDIGINMDIEGDILVTVCDNGCGMDRSTLLDGMTYGATGTVDPKRLGKFGLGLKTASTAFCRKLSVVTRDSNKSEILKATWDLDHVVKVGQWELLMENPNKDEIELLEKIAIDGSGTLVVWDKIDRILKKYSEPTGTHAKKALYKVIEQFRRHAAMIYQRFLDRMDERARNIEITINGASVDAWDPFCESEPDTEIVGEQEQDVTLSDGTESKFKIRAFVLPRRENFTTSENATKAELTNSRQGIYVYRENRLIHPSDWLGMFTKEPHFTLLRVEFSFDHDLDDAFQVDIKKSRILLNDQLYDWIKTKFLPAPRNAADERYRKGRRKQVTAKSKHIHNGSNRSIGEKEEQLLQADIEVIDKDSGEVEVTNRNGKTRLVLTISNPKQPEQLFVEPATELDDGVLWEPAIIHGHHAVRINTGHPYYHKVYVPNTSSNVTIQGLDSLLWALVEAELGTINESTKRHFQELRFEVSRLLRLLVETLPEPVLEEQP